MSTGAGRWLWPTVAAIAVLTVITVLWQLRPFSEDDAAPAAGGGTPPSAGAEPGDPGSSDGSGGPGGILEPSVPPDEPGGGMKQGVIAVDSYYPYDARRLAINYTNGVPECYGRAATPRVEETPAAVIVTIPRIPPKPDPDKACIDIALMSSIDVTLDAPLGDRRVLDGSRDNMQVKAVAAPHDPNQAK